MATIPVRTLDSVGVIRDQSPAAIPLGGWSNGRNVLFQDGMVMRSPIWRTIMDGMAATGSPLKFCVSLTPSSGFDQIVVCRDDSSMLLYANEAFTNVSPVGWTARGGTTAPWTYAFLGDVLYVNRSDGVPQCLLPGAANFAPMPSWNSSWTTNCIRSYQDCIVALNVTKGGAATPTMVKVSDITYFGQEPQSWDASNPTTLAYENPIAQLDGPILDGQVMTDRFIFYTGHQTWEMRSDVNFLYTFRKLPITDGLIATNCVIERDGVHYCFGSSDLFMHDGQTKTSLVDQKNRQFIYRTMDKTRVNNNFVAWIPQTNEIMFAYVSSDPTTAFKTPLGCNNAFMYNVVNGTGSFVDLPNVSFVTIANANNYLTWATAGTKTWDGVGGSWYDQQDGRGLSVVAVNNPLNTPFSLQTIDGTGQLLGYDFVDTGQLAYQADLSCLGPSFVERLGIALDQPNAGGAPLREAKLIRAIMPELSISRPLSITISVGATMTPSGPVVYSTPQTFDPVADYKIDSSVSGRYLAIRFDFEPMADTQISGFDIDAISIGRF